MASNDEILKELRELRRDHNRTREEFVAFKAVIETKLAGKSQVKVALITAAAALGTAIITAIAQVF